MVEKGGNGLLYGWNQLREEVPDTNPRRPATA